MSGVRTEATEADRRVARDLARVYEIHLQTANVAREGNPDIWQACIVEPFTVLGMRKNEHATPWAALRALADAWERAAQ